MKIGFFTMPVHRLDKNYTECLKEDREAIILADKLGYSEAYVGEHVTDAAESITNSMLFQASLIAETKQIKLGTGTTNLSHSHPVLVAAQAATCRPALHDGRPAAHELCCYRRKLASACVWYTWSRRSRLCRICGR